VIEVGAVGIGLVLKAILVSAAADATGILAAGLVAVFGLTLLPHRRRKAAEALRDRTAEVREELRSAIAGAVGAEVAGAQRQMAEAVAPYSEFLDTEARRLDDMRSEVDQFEEQIGDLRVRIEAVAANRSG
jgi:hypothetical protein